MSQKHVTQWDKNMTEKPFSSAIGNGLVFHGYYEYSLHRKEDELSRSMKLNEFYKCISYWIIIFLSHLIFEQTDPTLYACSCIGTWTTAVLWTGASMGICSTHWQGFLWEILVDKPSLH